MKQYSPTTPSRRHMTTVNYGVLDSTKPFKRLVVGTSKKAGRNNRGRITVRHQGGGNKKSYRLIDFKQNKLIDIPAKVETLEYDPFRTGFIARIVYQNGQRSYVIASKDMKAGNKIITSENAPLKDGNRLLLKNIPVGYLVHNVELSKGKGGQMARSAGSYAEILAQDDGFTHLKLSSSEVRKVSWDNFASIGQVSNTDHNLITIGKAGRSRWLGIRPTVRGSVMNPCDHPYGGGEGRTQRGLRKPKTLWGKVTGGRKTRGKKKWSNKLIVKRRAKK